jgi:hypothetical protein
MNNKVAICHPGTSCFPMPCPLSHLLTVVVEPPSIELQPDAISLKPLYNHSVAIVCYVHAGKLV